MAPLTDRGAPPHDVSDPPVDRPIFIVGCPRSGTGVLHQLLRLHPQLAWITPITDRALGRVGYFFERPAAAGIIERIVRHLPPSLIPEVYSGPFDGSLQVPGLPETSEGQFIWDSYCPEEPDHYLNETMVTPEAESYFRGVAAWHCTHFDRPRFLSKRPRNVLRIRYINRIFPDAHFVHLIRDGRAVAASILSRRGRTAQKDWWGARPPGWRKQLDKPVIVQCAWQWQMCVELGRRDGSTLADNRYHEITYGELTEQPRETVTRLLETVELPTNQFFTPTIDTYLNRLENRNDRWQARLSADEREQLLEQLDRPVTLPDDR